MNKTNWYILDALFLVSICGGIAFLSIHYSNSTECRKRYFTASDIDSRALDSFVCVCSGSICDEPKPLGDLAQGATIMVYRSSRAKDRLKQKIIEFQTGGNNWGDRKIPSVTIAVDNSRKYQKIFGFGGAFTDAAGINMKSLSETTQQTLMEAYFGDKGLNYTIGRVPIASCDFSARVYSYLDTEGDFDLKTFALAPEDFHYKIPYILQAWKLSKGRIKLFASPWSAPAWMKTNNKMKNGGTLKGELNGKYYQTYAQYFVRFFQEYFKQGILFWGLTVQNEPSMGLSPLMRYQSMNFTYIAERSFIKNVLKPALTQSDPSADLKIMALDDNRDLYYNGLKK
uniref:Glucosylceramidase n=1 Tax=Ditylenchus dipsaci TaxID=166011 RepID=A0A915DQU3_9BILA